MRVFGKRILERLDETGMTKDQLMRSTGISAYALRSWISGERSPNAFNVVIVSKVLDRSTDWMLGITNKPRRFGQ